MAENLRLARLYLLLLAIFTVGRWLMGTFKVPYEKGHHVFSIVILTWTACVFYGAFCRRWRGHGPGRAAVLGLTLGLASQLVIFAATVASYALGLKTYFNHPTALNVRDPTQAVPFVDALVVRFSGLVVNTLVSSLAGALGWALGALLPEDRPPS